MGNLVAILGRPNVGKSTLFNRLISNKKAIVDSIEGVTRDRHYGISDWNGKTFNVVDTGGYIKDSEDTFESEIRKQVIIAIEECTAAILMVDSVSGLLSLDKDIADVIRRYDRPIFLVANKVDNFRNQLNASEFYSLGFDKLYHLSAISGSGTGELLDDLVEVMDFEEGEKDELPRFSILGRPNAGKSSFVNALLGDDRSIVTDIAGTTRDSIESLYSAFGMNFYLVDTAGIRKKTKISESLEFYSILRAIKALEESDIALLIIDAERGFEKQDQNIFWLANRNNKGVVVLVNKWDLIGKDTMTTVKFEKEIREKIKPFDDVPIVFISTLTKQRIFKAMETALEVFKNRAKKIPTNKLNKVLLPIMERNPPPATKGKYIKIKYCTQLNSRSPKFTFFANFPQYIKEPYQRFVENKIRENFDFTGVPIRVYFRKK